MSLLLFTEERYNQTPYAPDSEMILREKIKRYHSKMKLEIGRSREVEKENREN